MSRTIGLLKDKEGKPFRIRQDQHATTKGEYEIQDSTPEKLSKLDKIISEAKNKNSKGE